MDPQQELPIAGLSDLALPEIGSFKAGKVRRAVNRRRAKLETFQGGRSLDAGLSPQQQHQQGHHGRKNYRGGNKEDTHTHGGSCSGDYIEGGNHQDQNQHHASAVHNSLSPPVYYHGHKMAETTRTNTAGRSRSKSKQSRHQSRERSLDGGDAAFDRSRRGDRGQHHEHQLHSSTSTRSMIQPLVHPPAGWSIGADSVITHTQSLGNGSVAVDPPSTSASGCSTNANTIISASYYAKNANTYDDNAGNGGGGMTSSGSPEREETSIGAARHHNLPFSGPFPTTSNFESSLINLNPFKGASSSMADLNQSSRDNFARRKLRNPNNPDSRLDLLAAGSSTFASPLRPVRFGDQESDFFYDTSIDDWVHRPGPQERSLAVSRTRFEFQKKDVSLRRRKIDSKIRSLGDILTKRDYRSLVAGTTTTGTETSPPRFVRRDRGRAGARKQVAEHFCLEVPGGSPTDNTASTSALNSTTSSTNLLNTASSTKTIQNSGSISKPDPRIRNLPFTQTWAHPWSSSTASLDQASVTDAAITGEREQNSLLHNTSTSVQRDSSWGREGIKGNVDEVEPSVGPSSRAGSKDSTRSKQSRGDKLPLLDTTQSQLGGVDSSSGVGGTTTSAAASATLEHTIDHFPSRSRESHSASKTLSPTALFGKTNRRSQKWLSVSPKSRERPQVSLGIGGLEPALEPTSAEVPPVFSGASVQLHVHQDVEDENVEDEEIEENIGSRSPQKPGGPTEEIDEDQMFPVDESSPPSAAVVIEPARSNAPAAHQHERLLEKQQQEHQSMNNRPALQHQQFLVPNNNNNYNHDNLQHLTANNYIGPSPKTSPRTASMILAENHANFEPRRHEYRLSKMTKRDFIMHRKRETARKQPGGENPRGAAATSMSGFGTLNFSFPKQAASMSNTFYGMGTNFNTSSLWSNANNNRDAKMRATVAGSFMDGPSAWPFSSVDTTTTTATSCEMMQQERQQQAVEDQQESRPLEQDVAVPPWAHAGMTLERPDGAEPGSQWADASKRGPGPDHSGGPRVDYNQPSSNNMNGGIGGNRRRGPGAGVARGPPQPQGSPGSVSRITMSLELPPKMSPPRWTPTVSGGRAASLSPRSMSKAEARSPPQNRKNNPQAVGAQSTSNSLDLRQQLSSPGAPFEFETPLGFEPPGGGDQHIPYMDGAGLDMLGEPNGGANRSVDSFISSWSTGEALEGVSPSPAKIRGRGRAGAAAGGDNPNTLRQPSGSPTPSALQKAVINKTHANMTMSSSSASTRSNVGHHISTTSSGYSVLDVGPLGSRLGGSNTGSSREDAFQQSPVGGRGRAKQPRSTSKREPSGGSPVQLHPLSGAAGVAAASPTPRGQNHQRNNPKLSVLQVLPFSSDAKTGAAAAAGEENNSSTIQGGQQAGAEKSTNKHLQDGSSPAILPPTTGPAASSQLMKSWHPIRAAPINSSIRVNINHNRGDRSSAEKTCVQQEQQQAASPPLASGPGGRIAGGGGSSPSIGIASPLKTGMPGRLFVGSTTAKRGGTVDLIGLGANSSSPRSSCSTKLNLAGTSATPNINLPASSPTLNITFDGMSPPPHLSTTSSNFRRTAAQGQLPTVAEKGESAPPSRAQQTRKPCYKVRSPRSTSPSSPSIRAHLPEGSALDIDLAIAGTAAAASPRLEGTAEEEQEQKTTANASPKPKETQTIGAQLGRSVSPSPATVPERRSVSRHKPSTPPSFILATSAEAVNQSQSPRGRKKKGSLSLSPRSGGGASPLLQIAARGSSLSRSPTRITSHKAAMSASRTSPGQSPFTRGRPVDAGGADSGAPSSRSSSMVSLQRSMSPLRPSVASLVIQSAMRAGAPRVDALLKKAAQQDSDNASFSGSTTIEDDEDGRGHTSCSSGTESIVSSNIFGKTTALASLSLGGAGVPYPQSPGTRVKAFGLNDPRVLLTSKGRPTTNSSFGATSTEGDYNMSDNGVDTSGTQSSQGGLGRLPPLDMSSAIVSAAGARGPGLAHGLGQSPAKLQTITTSSARSQSFFFMPEASPKGTVWMRQVAGAGRVEPLPRKGDDLAKKPRNVENQALLAANDEQVNLIFNSSTEEEDTGLEGRDGDAPELVDLHKGDKVYPPTDQSETEDSLLGLVDHVDRDGQPEDSTSSSAEENEGGSLSRSTSEDPDQMHSKKPKRRISRSTLTLDVEAASPSLDDRVSTKVAMASGARSSSTTNRNRNVGTRGPQAPSSGRGKAKDAAVTQENMEAAFAASASFSGFPAFAGNALPVPPGGSKTGSRRPSVSHTPRIQDCGSSPEDLSTSDALTVPLASLASLASCVSSGEEQDGTAGENSKDAIAIKQRRVSKQLLLLPPEIQGPPAPLSRRSSVASNMSARGRAGSLSPRNVNSSTTGSGSSANKQPQITQQQQVRVIQFGSEAAVDHHNAASPLEGSSCRERSALNESSEDRRKYSHLQLEVADFIGGDTSSASAWSSASSGEEDQEDAKLQKLLKQAAKRSKNDPAAAAALKQVLEAKNNPMTSAGRTSLRGNIPLIITSPQKNKSPRRRKSSTSPKKQISTPSMSSVDTGLALTGKNTLGSGMEQGQGLGLMEGVKTVHGISSPVKRARVDRKSMNKPTENATMGEEGDAGIASAMDSSAEESSLESESFPTSDSNVASANDGQGIGGESTFLAGNKQESSICSVASGLGREKRAAGQGDIIAPGALLGQSSVLLDEGRSSTEDWPAADEATSKLALGVAVEPKSSSLGLPTGSNNLTTKPPPSMRRSSDAGGNAGANSRKSARTSSTLGGTGGGSSSSSGPMWSGGILPNGEIKPRTFRSRSDKKDFVESEILRIEHAFERAKRNAGRGERVVMLGPERAKIKLLRQMVAYLQEYEQKVKGGKVEVDDALSAMQYFLVSKFKTLKKAFQFFDFNANGSLAYIEMTSGLDMLLPKIWPDIDTLEFLFGASSEDIYKLIDEDDSGSIDMREFCRKRSTKINVTTGDVMSYEEQRAARASSRGRMGSAGSLGAGLEDDERNLESRRGSTEGSDGRGGNIGDKNNNKNRSSVSGAGRGRMFDDSGFDGNGNERAGSDDDDSGDDENGGRRPKSKGVRGYDANGVAIGDGDGKDYTSNALDPEARKAEAQRRVLDKLVQSGDMPPGWELDENGNWTNRETGESLSDDEFKNRYGHILSESTQEQEDKALRDELNANERSTRGEGGSPVFNQDRNGAHSRNVGSRTGTAGRGGVGGASYGHGDGNGGAGGELTSEEIQDGILQRVFIAACQGNKANGHYVMVRSIFAEFLDEMDICDLSGASLVKIFDRQMSLQSLWTYATQGLAIREGLTYEFFKLALHEITRLSRVTFSDFVLAC
ncbi:unnamed protein product [Amoebophrya sp. A25]|nr:unnamed protein product [Amoebophrya sp. A25]|eukprot:GSA25T00003267001.1